LCKGNNLVEVEKKTKKIVGAHLVFMLSGAQNIIQSTPSATPPMPPHQPGNGNSFSIF